ncbi:carbohydrate porin [Klebsiella sp. I138]|uniref:carbohydrate porin n=1 Tax=Klebsiella sp. I138 TaxID=2755385 RepID=UPI003DA9F940
MKKILLTFTLALVSFNSLADMTFDTSSGKLRFYGDVEFNTDAASSSKQLTSSRTSPNKDWSASDSDRWSINGRILLGLDGYRELPGGNFAGFISQPLADMSGHMNLDDAALYFGQKEGGKDNWRVTVGRFEAYDMFPINQDTFVEYSGNTANDLYADGFGYIYMMKEGRGRSNSGGNLMLSKSIDNWYFELNSLVEDGSDLFAGASYHGNTLTRKKNTIYLRPVVAWRGDNFTTAVAAESNVVNNAYGYHNTSGQWQDQSERNGFGWSSTLKIDHDITANINFAFMDAVNEKDLTVGANILWDKFAIGYIWAKNKLSDFNPALQANNDDFIDQDGKYQIHTIHSSYRFANVLDMNNFDIYLGAYWSQIKRNSDNLYSDGENSDDRYGMRIRFKYNF